MLNRFAIAPLALMLLGNLMAAPLLTPAAAQVPNCIRGRDCADQVYRRILANYPKELAAAKQANDIAKQVRVINRAGEAHQYFGEFAAAIALYQQALLLARQAKDRKGEADVLYNLATTHNKQSPPNGGIGFLERELQQVSGDRESQKIVLNTLGSISINLENYQKVLESYSRYLQLVRQDNDSRSEATALWNSAIALSYLGNLDGAIAAMEKALALQNQESTPETPNIYLSQLAEFYLQKGDVDRAGRTYDRIVKNSISRDSIINPYRVTRGYEGLATAYAAIKKLDAAQAVLKGILDLADSVDGLENSLRQEALDKLSLTYAWQGNYAKAIATQQTIAKLTGNPGAVFEDHLGAFYLRSGNFKAAETSLRQAIAGFARSREDLTQNNSNLSPNSFDQALRSNFDIVNAPYRNLEEALVGQKRLGEALEISEEGRARAYLALLANRLGVTKELQPNIPSITLERIKQVAKTQNTTLVEYSIIYADIVGLRSSQTLFRYGTEKPKPIALHIWVIQPGGVVTLRVVNLAEKLPGQSLEQLVRSSRESLGIRGRNANTVIPNATTQKLRQLYDVLIQPIADLLPTDPAQTVTIIPQDELFLVPFAAIKLPTDQYLIERHTLLSAPSIQILELTHSLKNRNTAAPGNTALIVGNPTMPSLRFALDQPPQPLPPLPGAETEAKAIAQILKTSPLLGSQATKTRVEAELGRARLIHLATHGILENLQGLQSALAFAPSDRDDGFLSTKEILKLKLKADLVVLSACDTGRGQISGDGVLGISRSFISAGTPSLVVSLWAIPDDSTAALMTYFYENLQTQPNKAIALRQAMLSTMKNYPYPQDWAAFTLVGEAR